MKIIFLDIDGVISTYEKRWCLDENKLDLLVDILYKTNAKIVISSSWRRGCNNADDIKEHFKTFRITDTILHSETFNIFLDNIIDITPQSSPNGSERGNEIQDWLNTHDVKQYVILDDESDMLDEQLFNFVQTDSYEGLTEREVKLCVTILNNEKVINPIRLNYTLRNEWLNNCNGIITTNIRKRINDYTLL